MVLLKKMSDQWNCFYTQILPTLQAMLYPLPVRDNPKLSHSNHIATQGLNEYLMSNLYNDRVTNVVNCCMDIAQFVVLCMFYFLEMNPSSSTFISLDTF